VGHAERVPLRDCQRGRSNRLVSAYIVYATQFAPTSNHALNQGNKPPGEIPNFNFSARLTGRAIIGSTSPSVTLAKGHHFPSAVSFVSSETVVASMISTSCAGPFPLASAAGPSRAFRVLRVGLRTFVAWTAATRDSLVKPRSFRSALRFGSDRGRPRNPYLLAHSSSRVEVMLSMRSAAASASLTGST